MTFFREILELLNENTHGAKFDGERFFQYNQNGEFAVYEKSTAKAMEYQKIDFTPMSELAQTETPFVDLNKRSDFLKQFIFAIRVEQQDFEDTNPSYLALRDFAVEYQGETITINGDEYTLKTFEPVREGQPLKMGNYADWFVLVSLSMNVTKLPEGHTGSHVTLEVSEDGTNYHQIDATNITIPTSTDIEGSRSLTTMARNKYHANGKTIEIHADVNHRYRDIDKVIVSALKSKDYTKEFWVRFIDPNDTTEIYECMIKDGTPEYENGIPISYVVTFVERA